MKTLRVLITLAIFSYYGVFKVKAQESDMDDRSFRFGLVAAPNLGWLDPTIQEFDKDGLRGKLGLSYGLMADYKFSESPNYLFSTGIQFLSIGGGLSEPYDTLDINTSNDTNYYYGIVDRTYRASYVTIPLLLKMRTNEIGYLSYFGAIGLDLGVRTRAFVSDEYRWQSNPFITEQADINFRQNTSLFRLAVNLTLGGEFNISGNTNAYVALSYHNAFTNIFSNDPTNRILEPTAEGGPVLSNGFAVLGKQRKAVLDYFALNVGIFF
jgi:hypothetical protein